MILPGDVIGFPVSFFDRSIYSVVAVSDLTYNVCPLDFCNWGFVTSSLSSAWP